jgi:PAS domain S-box-containing protein
MTTHDHVLEQYKTMVETVPDGVYTLDPDFYFTSVNDGLVTLTGYSRDDLVGSHVSLILDESVIENAAERREYLKEHPDEVLTTQYDLHTAAGESIPVEVRFTPLEFDDEYRGTAGVIRDVSERLKRQRELQRQRDELDELDRINDVIRDIDQALVTATSREAVEQAVCDRLAASNPYRFAWIGEYAAEYTELTPRASAGVEAGYFDEVLDDGDGRQVEGGPGAEAMRTRTVQTVQRIHDDDAFAPWREDASARGYESLAAIPLVYEDVEYGVLAVYSGRSHAFDDRETEVLGELGETISHAIAALEREQREQSLTALHESTRGLLRTDTYDEISQLVVESAVTDLALSGALLYRFDDTRNVLFPDASAGGFAADVDTYPSFSPGADDILWTVFIEGEVRTVDDLTALPGDTGSSAFSSAMIVPVGDHGVVVVAGPELGAFDRNMKKLVDLLAATTEAAFDRVESEAELRERDELLAEQNERLTRLNRLNEILRDVDQGLIQATTRDEIEQLVCDRLTANERFRFAWIGERETAGNRLAPRAWNGVQERYLDSVGLELDEDTAEPAVETARAGDVTRVANVATDIRAESWRSEAFARAFQSVVSVPLTYEDYSYGVLTVYADQAGLFGEKEQAVFAELGQTVANAINAVETKQALLTDSVVELDFRLHGDTQSFLPQLARRIDAELEFVGIAPVDGDAERVFFTVSGVPAEDVRDALEALVTVDSFRVVTEDDEALFEATVTGSTIASVVVEHGAAPRTIRVVEGTVHVVIELPQSANVREFIEMLQNRYADAEFVARRDRERPMQTRQEFQAELEDALTERQLDVLKTAFYSGYFESPRETTGQELADALGVSGPTVTGHLRAAERKLLSLVFDA